MNSKHVKVREVGLRDGLQMVKTLVPTGQKLEWIEQEFAAGMREIEVCSFVPPKLMPQFADSEEIVKHALSIPGLIVSALIPNLKGAELGVANRVHKLNYVISASEAHNLANVRRTIQESAADFERVVNLVRASSAGTRPKVGGGISTAFGCTLQGAVSTKSVVDLAKTLLATGADELTIADTVGYANPVAIRSVYEAVLNVAGDIPVVAHLHDTRGLGIANALAALEVGIRHFDASLAGLGGCPHAPGATGNVNTEDLVFLLESMGYDTGIDLEHLLKARKFLRSILPREEMFGALARAGLPKTFRSMSV